MSEPVVFVRAEVRLVADSGRAWEYTLAATDRHEIIADLIVDQPAAEITEYGVDAFRRFKPGPDTFVDVRIRGRVETP